LGTYCKKAGGIEEQDGLEQEDFQTVLRAAGETETTQYPRMFELVEGEQEDFQTVLRAAGETATTQYPRMFELDEGDSALQLLTKEESAAVIFFYYLFSSALPILLNFSFPFIFVFRAASLIRIIH
jgi:hypothetical protein